MNCLVHALLEWSKNKNLIIYYNGDHVIGVDISTNTLVDYKNLYLSDFCSDLVKNGAERSGNFKYLELTKTLSRSALNRSFNLRAYYGTLLTAYFNHIANNPPLTVYDYYITVNKLLKNLPEVFVIKVNNKFAVYSGFKLLEVLSTFPSSPTLLINGKRYKVYNVNTF